MHKAQLAQGRGDLRSALAHAHEGIALTEADSQGASYLPGYLLRRSDIHLQAGHLGPALADAARALDLLEKAVDAGSFSCELGRAHLALGRVLQAQGRLAEGASSLASALQHLEPTLGRDHPDARLARRLVRAAGNP
jgi:tetratricopeptide (TPR) repeat protein